MDETTKVIIATLSGFIIAFFAEPVKNYFQNKAKLHNLRIALYKELLHNYATLGTYVLGKNNDGEDWDFQFWQTEYTIRFALRTECYTDSIQNEIPLFYQLKEADMINFLQGTLLRRIIGFSGDLNRWFGDDNTEPAVIDAIHSVSETFRDSFAFLSYTNRFDRKILRQLLSATQYKEMMERGENETTKKNGLIRKIE